MMRMDAEYTPVVDVADLSIIDFPLSGERKECV